MARVYIRVTQDAYDDVMTAQKVQHLMVVALQAYRPPDGMKLVGITPTDPGMGRQGGMEIMFDVDPVRLQSIMQRQGVKIPQQHE